MKTVKTLYFILLVAATGIILASCGQSNKHKEKNQTMNITAEEAKNIMDSETGYVILDVRTKDEYNDGHIPGAVLVPDYDIKDKAGEVLTDKNQLILVYCRSGRRSKNAADILVSLGYTNIKEFGGIIDWPYDIEK